MEFDEHKIIFYSSDIMHSSMISFDSNYTDFINIKYFTYFCNLINPNHL